MALIQYCFFANLYRRFNTHVSALFADDSFLRVQYVYFFFFFLFQWLIIPANCDYRMLNDMKDLVQRYA